MVADVIDFIHQPTGAPTDAVHHAKRSLLDLIGVWTAGRTTDLSTIIHEHAFDQFGAGQKAARLIFDGRAVSPVGAALAGAMTIDSIDAHDGYKPAKGHAGCYLLPALKVMWNSDGLPDDGAGFLHSLIMGYEVACRVAEAQHDTVHDYHSPGSWGAVGARLLGLDAERTRHDLAR